MWRIVLFHNSAAHNQLSMWRQLELHTEMNGMNQAAQATAPCQPCQAPLRSVLQHASCVGRLRLWCLAWENTQLSPHGLYLYLLSWTGCNLSEKCWKWKTAGWYLLFSRVQSLLSPLSPIKWITGEVFRWQDNYPKSCFHWSCNQAPGKLSHPQSGA